ncbi:hypothetical protein V1511DRAFT_485850 [Dipodascopsis uninucleata]
MDMDLRERRISFLDEKARDRRVSTAMNETWDDDFQGMDDELSVPSTIENNQEIVITHLRNIREFAKTVEPLRQLMITVHGSQIQRQKIPTTTLEEAEAIVALADNKDEISEDEICDGGVSLSPRYRSSSTRESLLNKLSGRLQSSNTDYASCDENFVNEDAWDGESESEAEIVVNGMLIDGSTPIEDQESKKDSSKIGFDAQALPSLIQRAFLITKEIKRFINV